MNYEHFTPSHEGSQRNIFLIDMTKEVEHHFSELVRTGLEKYLRLGKRIGFLINKKGRSNGVLCKGCGHVPQCTSCSVSIHYHRLPSGDEIGLCHICKRQYAKPTSCPKCGNKNINDFGLGVQKVVDFLHTNYTTNTLVLESDTVNSEKKRENLIAQIQEKNPIIVGTSLLSTPLPFYELDLLIIPQADIGLHIPDYTAMEKNFWMLYKTFLNHPKANILVQTHNPDQNSIRSACRLDPVGFEAEEMKFREQFQYPPFTELCLILYKNEIEEKVFTKVDQCYKELLYLREKYDFKDLQIYSTPPLIYKMFGKYRYNIILKGPNLRHFMDIVFSKLKLTQKGFKLDWKAESIV